MASSTTFEARPAHWNLVLAAVLVVLAVLQAGLRFAAEDYTGVGLWSFNAVVWAGCAVAVRRWRLAVNAEGVTQDGPFRSRSAAWQEIQRLEWNSGLLGVGAAFIPRQGRRLTFNPRWRVVDQEGSLADLATAAAKGAGVPVIGNPTSSTARLMVVLLIAVVGGITVGVLAGAALLS